MSHRFPLLSTALALLVLCSPCRAQVNEAVDLVPADSLGFLMIKNLRQFSDKIQQTANKLGVKERVSFLELIKKEMGLTQGINDNGSVVFIVLKSKDESGIPDVIVALPVSDRQKIAAQLGLKQLKEEVAEAKVGLASSLLGSVHGEAGAGQPVQFPIFVAGRGNFVLLSERQGMFTKTNLKESLTALITSKNSISTDVQGAWQWLEQQDLAGICTDKDISHGLGLIMEGGGGGVAQDTKGQASQLQAAFADIPKNMKFVAFGGRIDDTLSWSLSTAIHLRPDGDHANWIAKAEPANLGLLKLFPNERNYVA